MPACPAFAQPGQSAMQDSDYRLRLPIDEVILTLHASGPNGIPIRDLTLNDLQIRDNNRAPRAILAFDPLQDAPLHTGILIDTSSSVESSLPIVRQVATEAARQLTHDNNDRSFLMDFGLTSSIAQSWTHDPAIFAAHIRNVRMGARNPLGGTALFDSLFRACFYQFGKSDRFDAGNVLLLFSDGEDNASHVSLREVVGACQDANVAIYAFRALPAFYSTGPKNLADLALQTGGRVFDLGDSSNALDHDLQLIDSEARNQYRLVYRPAALLHDGSFHRIELSPETRDIRFTVRSGYYASQSLTAPQ
jgi:Ca-activated chloride channel homolog